MLIIVSGSHMLHQAYLKKCKTPISDQGKSHFFYYHTFIINYFTKNFRCQFLNHLKLLINRSMSRRAFRRNHPSGGGAISSGAVPTVAEAMEFEAMDTSAPFPPPQL